jgi:hypothetical protein
MERGLRALWPMQAGERKIERWGDHLRWRFFTIDHDHHRFTVHLDWTDTTIGEHGRGRAQVQVRYDPLGLFFPPFSPGR